MKPYLLAHDLGTSGNKATLFDIEGNLIASRTASYETSYATGNRAEQNPADWWRAVCDTSRAILMLVDKNEIGAVTLSGQMMGCLCVDRFGRPLRNAIIYSDQRATEEARILLERVDGRDLYRTTGHRISASYSVEKLMWIKANEPEAYRITRKMLQAKDYINFKLTGRMATDFNDASGTNCFDIGSKQWAQAIVTASGVDPEMLPEAHPSTSVLAAVTAEASAETGLAAGTPVVIGAGDGGCATVGAGCVKEGVFYHYLGSSSWISSATSEPLIDEEMRTFTWVHPAAELYQPCGTVQTAGSAVSWLAGQIYAGGSGIGEAEALAAVNREAAASPVGANGLVFLPYLLGERSPRWNPEAKGAWIGLKLTNTRGDLARSVLEGVALNLEIVLSVLRGRLAVPEIILIGGGARSLLWRQILADTYGVRILVPERVEEATSMGAAIIGGVGTGCFDFAEGARRFVHVTETVDPEPSAQAQYAKMKLLFEECYRVLERTMGKM